MFAFYSPKKIAVKDGEVKNYLRSLELDNGGRARPLECLLASPDGGGSYGKDGRDAHPPFLYCLGFSNILGSIAGLAWIAVYFTVLESLPSCLF